MIIDNKMNYDFLLPVIVENSKIGYKTILNISVANRALFKYFRNKSKKEWKKYMNLKEIVCWPHEKDYDIYKYPTFWITYYKPRDIKYNETLETMKKLAITNRAIRTNILDEIRQEIRPLYNIDDLTSIVCICFWVAENKRNDVESYLNTGQLLFGGNPLLFIKPRIIVGFYRKWIELSNTKNDGNIRYGCYMNIGSMCNINNVDKKVLENVWSYFGVEIKKLLSVKKTNHNCKYSDTIRIEIIAKINVEKLEKIVNAQYKTNKPDYGKKWW